ncbi:MAG TPA: ankyrin repeat domain-containing protein [Anaerohalosphaeraceae bacterium]|nr:ankyrin repeat domain-containing protein [Anaerohalosphaeraceae bacterium]
MVLIFLCGGTAVQAEQTLPNSPAIKQGNEILSEIRAWIQTGADIDAADEEGLTLLRMASEAGHVEAVRVLLAAGADVNQQDKSSRTPLSYASYHGHVEIVKLLLAAGADGDAYDDSGETPLFAAFLAFESEIVRLLLAAGANVNVVNRAWHTPLWFAALNQDPELVKLLLNAGACVNLTDKDDTPLYIASQHGATEIVKLLLEAGANADIKVYADGRYQTLLDIAKAEGRTQIVSLLEQYTGPEYTKRNQATIRLIELADSFEAKDIAELRELITAGADVNVVNKIGFTPLWVASSRGYTEMVELLLDAGANPNVVMCFSSCDGRVLSGLTALGPALDHHEIVNLLIAAGANVNAADSWGITPLSKAFRAGLIKTVKLLEEAGAKVHPEIQRNDKTYTSLSLEQQKSYLKIVQLLHDYGARNSEDRQAD